MKNRNKFQDYMIWLIIAAWFIGIGYLAIYLGN
jgi:hypothetical protein